MADEQINTPSTDAQPSDGAAAEQSSGEPREGSSPGWWQRLFNRRPAEEADSDGGDSSDRAGSTSKPLTLTQEELDRRIQAETDRREAKRAQEARIAAKKRLRDEDPWAYAEADRQEEQVGVASAQQQRFFQDIGKHHDAAVLDPIVMALPEAERKRILALEGAGSGLEGRRLIVTEALKVLNRQAEAEAERKAEQKLRRNQAFRKQVLSEARGGTVEPELLPGTTASAADQKVSDILRQFYGLPGPQREHNTLG